MNKLENITLEIAKKANTIINIENMKIPVLDGFEVKKDIKINSKHIFVAQKDNVLEQFLTDGQLVDAETLDERVEKILNDIRREVRHNPLYANNGRYIDLYKEYEKDNFRYKIYVQDILIDKEHFARQLNAYFVEPHSGEVCQISISAGQYLRSEYKILREINNYKRDRIIVSLEKALLLILDNIRYDYSE